MEVADERLEDAQCSGGGWRMTTLLEWWRLEVADERLEDAMEWWIWSGGSWSLQLAQWSWNG